MRTCTVRGFSLIELLVALVIFATMAVIAYAGLSSVTRARGALDEREREHAALGRALTLIERDLRSAAVRPVRGNAGNEIPALLGQGDVIELSSYGRGRNVGVDLGLVERVGYLRNEGGLQRLRWPVLDRSETTAPDRRLLLAGIEQLRWRYLALDGRWHSQWPVQDTQALDVLPRAVECTLVHPVMGEIRRLIELPAVMEP